MPQFIFMREHIDGLVKSTFFLEFIERGAKYFQACADAFSDTAHTLEEKVNAYHRVWENSINNLYVENIPWGRNPYSVGIEWTPFTVTLAEWSDIDLTDQFDLTEQDRVYCESLYQGLYPHMDSLSGRDEIIRFMLRILVIPPLMSIAEFYSRSYREHTQKLRAILETVHNLPFTIPEYKTNLGLHLADTFVDQNIYYQYGGMDGLLSDPLFSDLRPQLQAVKDSCKEQVPLPQLARCPHCGGVHRPTLKQDDIFYIHLIMLHKDLECQIAFRVLNDYRKLIGDMILNALQSAGKNINDISNPACYILVEGATEEKAIPYMAEKYGKSLAAKGIKVWSAGGKQKVRLEFEQFLKNDPTAKFCILLDSDAKSEADFIRGLMKEKHDRYALFQIPGKGEFEDLIDRKIAVQALNELYGEGVFSVDDFDDEKPFVKQVERMIHEDSTRGTFDKIRFIETVLPMLDKNSVPELIRQLIDECYCLVDSAPVARSH